MSFIFCPIFIGVFFESISESFFSLIVDASSSSVDESPVGIFVVGIIFSFFVDVFFDVSSFGISCVAVSPLFVGVSPWAVSFFGTSFDGVPIFGVVSCCDFGVSLGWIGCEWLAAELGGWAPFGTLKYNLRIFRVESILLS